MKQTVEMCIGWQGAKRMVASTSLLLFCFYPNQAAYSSNNYENNHLDNAQVSDTFKKREQLVVDIAPVGSSNRNDKDESAEWYGDNIPSIEVTTNAPVFRWISSVKAGELKIQSKHWHRHVMCDKLEHIDSIYLYILCDKELS